jgi:L-seryl-tRNA(Ser) seleniumtransferase
VRELAALGVDVVADIGSGLLRPESTLPGEPDASTWLADGATIVTASGDKLLGGPQAGVVVGHAEVVRRLRRHPLARALRVDKLTLAAFEATIRTAITPTRAALTADPTVLRARAESLAAALAAAGVPAIAVPSDGVVGGGGAPGQILPGAAVALPDSYAESLRTGDPCIVGRVERAQCLLDLRCIPAADDARLRDAVLAIASRTAGRDVTPCS